MIRRIVHHEWRALASDATVWVVAAIFGIAICSANFNIFGTRIFDKIYSAFF